MVAFIDDPSAKTVAETFGANATAVAGATHNPFASGKILSAHIANVLMSASLGILSMITMESFPRKYRYSQHSK